MRFFKFFLSLSIIVFIITGCTKESSKKNITSKSSETVQKDRFEFQLENIDGSKIKIIAKEDGIEFKDINSSVVMIDFFATWCPPCKAEIPHLVNLQDKYKKRFKIVGILLEKNKNLGDLKRFLDEYKINYFVSKSADNFELAKIVYAAVQAPRDMPIPLMVMFKNGKYVTHYLGAVPEEMIETDIKKALGE